MHSVELSSGEENETVALRGRQAAIRSRRGHQVAIRSGRGRQVAIRSGRGRQVAVRSGRGRQVAMRGRGGHQVPAVSSGGVSGGSGSHHVPPVYDFKTNYEIVKLITSKINSLIAAMYNAFLWTCGGNSLVAVNE